MPLKVNAVSASGFGAEISGVDLCRAITAEEYAKVESALSAHGVLFFRDQPVDDAQQEMLIRWFGPPNLVAADLNSKTNKNPYFYDVSNVDEHGQLMSQESERRHYLNANLLWHTDMSQRQPPARVTILSARELPDVDPPDTEFADMRAAWESLPPARQASLEELMAEHSIYASRAKVGFMNFTEETRKLLPPVVHPLVRTHKGSGRKCLYMGAKASRIVGWSEEKSMELFDELLELATQPQFVFAHKWKPRDVLLWDDSCTLHRSRPYDDQKYRRELRWCSARELESV